MQDMEHRHECESQLRSFSGQQIWVKVLKMPFDGELRQKTQGGVWEHWAEGKAELGCECIQGPHQVSGVFLIVHEETNKRFRNF